MPLLVSVALVVFGIAILGFCADVLVRGAVTIACKTNMPASEWPKIICLPGSTL